MKNKIFSFKILFIYLIFILSSSSVFSQTNNNKINYYQFYFSDSSSTIGSITFEDNNVVQIMTTSGNEIRVNRHNIISQTITEYKIVSPPDSIKIVKNTSSNVVLVDTAEITRLEMEGGSVLIGAVISEDSTSITICLLSKGTIIVEKSTIINREIVSSNIQNGQYWLNDPNSTRLFFAPTGRGLKSGKGYFSVYEIFFPMVALGVYDYVTLSGGMSLFPGSSEQIIYLAPKITFFQNERYAVSVGDFFVKIPDDSDNLNILYTVATASFNKGALTLGTGYETNSQNPIFLIGGELRISSNAKLITENWFINDSDFNFLSLGIRFLGKHLAADFAFVIPLLDDDDDDMFLFPWIGFAYNF